ncbi:MAG TPA: SRPBCC family protein [Solirubrobacterales bacterium]|nr:SRPBCC family protein [Solirubrobacterales bacterium]
MEFDNSFTVQKPVDEVWNTMVDLERVVPCVPGARVIEKTGEGAVTAEVKIKLGAMNMNYSGPAEIVERDDAEHKAVMDARAKEAGGQGNADAKVSMQLSGSGDATEVALHSQINVTGKAAQMGEGVIVAVTEGMIKEFAENLAKL